MLLNQIIFIGGKGGVGKSTISSSLALHLSLRKKKTLLISTDPAHNLNDLFKIPYSQEISQINDFLTLKQIDPKKEVIRYTQNIAKDAKTLIGAHQYEMIDRYYKSAAENGITQESALFDSLINIITQENNLWDHIIIDTAPTGHTLRFFTLAQTLKIWNQSMLNYQKKNASLYDILGSPSLENHSLLERLENRYKLYSEFQSILTDSQKTSAIFVLNPDLLSLEETKRALADLTKEKIHILALAINKVFPQSLDPFFQNRFLIQEKYLQRIQEEFPTTPQWIIPYLKEDILEQTHLLSVLAEFFPQSF